MSERLSKGLEFDKEQTQAVRQIGQRALDIAQSRYCSGFPDYRGGGIRKLGYNNARHDRMVGEDSVRLGERVGLSTGEQQLIRAAGYAHDLRQLRGRGADERESAEWIEEQLNGRRLFTPATAKMASMAILGTQPIFKDDRIVGQQVDQMKFDSKRDELFAKTLVSADLAELYTPMGPYLSHRLYAQRQGLGINETPQLDDLLEFQGKQIPFLENYRYPLREAESVFASHKRQVINYVKTVYEQLQRGDIATWQQLLAQDKEFMRRPNKRLY